jgi:hypothetical protein
MKYLQNEFASQIYLMGPFIAGVPKKGKRNPRPF